jgi:hypothetical protein
MRTSRKQKKIRNSEQFINVDLYVPLFSKDGRKLPAHDLKDLKERLIVKFDGLTFFPQKNKGFWKVGNSVFRDEIIIFRVLCPDNYETKTFWRILKVHLEEAWAQTHLLVTTQAVGII